MLPVYQIGVDSELLAISLVKDPAIEEDFQYFSKEQNFIKFSSDEKHQVIGPLIVADKLIYRRYQNQEFYVSFSKEAIEAMLYDFAKNGRNKSITLSHQEDVNGAVVTEIWTSGKNDKSHDFGYDLPEGSLFCSMKVNNADLWQKIKSGEVKGFSIESLLEVIDYNNFNKMNESKMNKDDKNETFFEKLKKLIEETFNTTTSKEPESTEEPQKTENSTASKEKFENEATEAVETPAQPETVENPQQTEVTEVVEPTAKTETVETPAQPETVETPVEEHQQTETVETTAKTVEAPNYEELYKSLKEENASTSKALEEIKKQVESLKAENETLKGRPSAEPVKPVSSGSRSFGETHDILRKLYERSPIQ